ncbi:MAG: SPFH domain-containing protein, partial [Eubacteriales bacterium]|nr:SPFH domain-containing protein [Eubacteriales bacterium]
FLKEVFGTNGMFTVEDVEGQIKRTLISGLSDAIAESKIPALDLAANYQELSQYALRALSPKVETIGLKLTDFVIENISLPEEVEKSIDKRTSMGVMGDLTKYTQFQAAEAMREAANNPNGGMAGMGVGMGAGVAMGQMFANSVNAAQQAAPQAATTPCVACGRPIPVGSKFCPECGAQQSVPNQCPKCGATLQPGTRFCPECGQKIG